MIDKENIPVETQQGMCATATSTDGEPYVVCVILDCKKSSESITVSVPVSLKASQLMRIVAKNFMHEIGSFKLMSYRYDIGELLDPQAHNKKIHDYENETLQELGFEANKNYCFAVFSKEHPPVSNKAEKESLPIHNSADEIQLDPSPSCSSRADKPIFFARTSYHSKERKEKFIIPLDEVGPEIMQMLIRNTRTHEQRLAITSGKETTQHNTDFELAPEAILGGPVSKLTPELHKTFSKNSTPKAPERSFVGLVNQAMTCYLNSLLQTLYMTPEFRNALYRWEFDGTEEEGTKSIPYQLQKLFLQLQTSDKSAVGTTDLTTSFGWDSSEAWQQHDVQELCRVMFDALEQKFKNTKQADLISRLYEGRLKDYVKCLECGYESAREDMFLDLPLVVRPFGSSQSYGSVEEALRAFVTPEILQDTNQYFCEHCNKKCDAHKGLKFIRLPYLLTLQLKRFDFDPMTMHRIKLNDRVAFPEILNLNEFVKSNANSHDICEDGDTADSGSALEDEGISGYNTVSSLSPEAFSYNELPDDDEGIDVGPTNPSLENSQELCVNERNLKKSMEKGPYVYELFSIMVHSGSANGGHYYAYIKSFKNGDWYCFNDAQVNSITYDDIQKTYGGGPSRGYYSSSYSSSTNAYMLIYRQIDKQKNAECMTPEEFPEHIKQLLQCMQEQEERERLQKELERSMCKIKLFCQHPKERTMAEMKLKVHESCTLAEATQTAYTILGLEGVVPLDCCRLVKYDDFHDSIECSFDPNTKETMGELLGGVKSSYKFDLLLEIKKPNEEFEEYRTGGTTIKLRVVHLDRKEVAAGFKTIRSHLNNTVEELRTQIANTLGVDGSKMRLVLEAYSPIDSELLDSPNETLINEGFSKSNKVFVEYEDAEDFEKPYNQSKLSKVIESYAYIGCIHISLPKVDKEDLERLRLQDCDLYEIDSSSEEEAEKKAFCSQTVGSKKSFKRNVRRNYSKYSSALDFEDCDEGLGGSETGDTASNGYPANQTIHSDHSEDSSLTDSERTLVGDELSPRNNSPDLMDSEMEQDLEPLHSGVEVSKPECDAIDAILTDSKSSCPVHRQDDGRNMSSPEENTKDSNSLTSSETCTCHQSQNSVPDPPVKRYFRAWQYTDHETDEQMLRCYLDRRITLAELKKELEPHVGIPPDCFKIFRVNSNNHETECTGLSEELGVYNDCKLAVKLGRALRKGEVKVLLYQFCLNSAEHAKYLLDVVLRNGMTILKAKKVILPLIKYKCGLDVPLNRCRLRQKLWNDPGTIFFDHQKLGKEITITQFPEMFLEVLTDAEPLTDPKHFSFYARMWHPSTYKLDPFKEVIITSKKEFKKQLSEISGVPEEYIAIAKGEGSFPCTADLLTLHKDLNWNYHTFSLIVGDDGDVFYYRDTREELKELTEEERQELMSNAKDGGVSHGRRAKFETDRKKIVRKEKALKIVNYPTNCLSSSGSAQSKVSEFPAKERGLRFYNVENTELTSTEERLYCRNLDTQSSQHIVPDLD